MLRASHIVFQFEKIKKSVHTLGINHTLIDLFQLQRFKYFRSVISLIYWKN